jgi:hypothetical protein
MVDERLPTVAEDDEETESVGFSEQITYFGQVMGAREAHKKAKDLFSNLPDSDRDSMSSDHDFNDSGSDGGLYDESKDDPLRKDMFAKPKVSNSAPLKWQKGKDQSRSTIAQSTMEGLKDHERDPETCCASFHH